MSEFTNTRGNAMSFRWQLLATVSAFALLGAAFGVGEVRAADDGNDHSLVWIELGGQLSRLNDGQEAFASPLMADRPSVFSHSQEFERPPLYSIDETASVLFQPGDSGWVISASGLYGRSGSHPHVHQQTTPPAFYRYYSGHTLNIAPSGARFADTTVRNDESHFILDFQAGKDVGLGMFGHAGSSTLNLGVRYAQFSSQSNLALKSDPDWHFHYKYIGTRKLTALKDGGVFHSNAAQLDAARSFHGIGPSLSWNASTPFAGNADRGEIALDWGVNAAILFGRQKANVHHQSTGRGHLTHATKYRRLYATATYRPPADSARSHTVTVPNVGGFAGLTFRVENFKMSAGYRADFFWGAMDSGIDTAKKENIGFYGPFASVSVGIGG